MSAIRIDDSEWPILVVTFVGVPSAGDFAAYLAGLDERLARGVPYAVILDARHAGVQPGRQRQQQAEWMKQNKEQLQRYLRGCAFVFSSPLLRIVLQGIFYLQPLPSAWMICGTLEEARRWAEARLAEGAA
jgi:hypothetical protein